MTIVTPPPSVERDRYGRPMIFPPNAKKPVAYTRCTTFIDVLDDKYNLQKWQQRMVALGLAARPDLMLSVSAHKDDKDELDRICESAREHAGATVAATTGTAVHALTELVDRGQELPILPDAATADVEAYRAATEPLKAVEIERLVVHDRLKVAGTPDRVVEYEGERYIADIKTGSIKYSALKIAMQLAIYAHSSMYDVTTHERTHHHASANRGIVIWVPAGEAKAELYWIDLEAGWAAVQVAKEVREQRRLKFAQLTEPFGPPSRPSLHRAKQAEQRAQTDAERELAKVAALIDASDDADVIRGLWVRYEAIWTDDLTERAKARIAQLPAAS